jgi:hypothetical protein
VESKRKLGLKISPHSKLSPKPNVHAKRFDDEVIVLDLGKGAYFSLDEVGAAVWEGFARGQSLQEIVHGLADQYQVPESTLLADTTELAGKLVEAGLAVIVSGPEPA